jgi:hypothetical protein
METKTITISKELYEKLKVELSEDQIKEINTYSDLIGQKVFIRTVTYHLVGKIVKIVGNLVFMEDASWIADSGRFMQAIKEGKLVEVEPIGNWFFNMSAVVDGGIWKHALPNKQI